MWQILTYLSRGPPFHEASLRFGGMLLVTNLSHLVKEKMGSEMKIGPRKACSLYMAAPDFHSLSFPKLCCTICPLPASVTVTGAVSRAPFREGVVRGGGQSSRFVIQLSDYNDVLQPCLYGACLFFRPKKRRKNHHTNNECQV